MTQIIQPRKPWLALLMSLVLPGYGQLYNGQPNKAVWLFFSFAFCVIPLGAIAALYLPESLLVPTLVLATLCSVGLWLYSMRDAWVVASQLGTYSVRVWQSSGMYLSALVLCGVFALPLIYSYVRGHWVEPFRIPSSSMEPSVLKGDFIMADKSYNCPGCKHAVRRGDIAIFTYPNNRNFHYIKRIVGLPGDKVQLRGREVFLNGQSLKVSEQVQPQALQVLEGIEGRNWTVRWGEGEKALPDTEILVPPGQVLVLGDNRNETQDSRAFGTVPLQDVVGRARQVWLSLADGVRWYRLGHVLQ
jgi:signal peptidase I